MTGVGAGKSMNIKAMTDKERTIDFLTIMGIGFKIKTDDNSHNTECDSYIKVSANYDGNQGYGYFFGSYEFDVNGKLLEFGVWE